MAIKNNFRAVNFVKSVKKFRSVIKAKYNRQFRIILIDNVSDYSFLRQVTLEKAGATL